MKLQPLAPSALNTITGYGEGYVMINAARHEANLIVLPERILPWEVAGFAALEEAHFKVFAELNLEILLLGTGPRQRFPHPRLTRALAERRIGVEAMDLQAACRTYNILMAEERRVAAALLFA
ncbi:MAG TPA: Mth938-like domain-containing protein [Burkholderiales bacterium]|nr:Mth938-like domain-containing protein [Burkholderiales bacterium]